jgi:hypothetical protein
MFIDFLRLQKVKGLGLGVFINAEGAEDEEDGWVNEQHGPKIIVLLPKRKGLSISFIWL